MANSLNKVTTKSILEATVATADIADDAVTLAKMAAGTDGQIITYDASGNPTAVGPGTDGQVLTSTGAGSPPAFEAIPTQISLANDANNRVITGTGSGLNGEANLTFDGTVLEITNATPKLKLIDSDATGTPEAMIDGSGGDLYLHVDKDDEKGSSLFGVKVDGSTKLLVQSTGDVQLETGDVILATNGAGIQFHPHAAANKLDDYEEGTFSMNLWASSTSFSTNPNMTNNNCRYTKVGNLVTINAYVAWGTDGAGGGGNLYMGGLPFTQNNSQIYAGVYFGWYSLQEFNEDEIFAGYINSNQSYIVLECLETDGAGRSSRNLQAAAANGVTGSVQINMSYTV